jgi:hypothetical protein
MAVNKFGPLALVYPDGSPVANKPIMVRRNRIAATLFATIAGVTQLPNPINTNASGEVEFFAEEGSLELEVIESGYTMNVVVYQPDSLGSSELGEVKEQSAPAANWNFTHGLGRLPTVSVYLDSGEEVDTDITASAVDVIAVWPVPMAGKLVLT